MYIRTYFIVRYFDDDDLFYDETFSHVLHPFCYKITLPFQVSLSYLHISVTPALHIITERSDRSILPGHLLRLFLDIEVLSSKLGEVIKLEVLQYDHRFVKRAEKNEETSHCAVRSCAIQSGSTSKKRTPPPCDQRSDKFSSYRIFHVRAAVYSVRSIFCTVLTAIR